MSIEMKILKTIILLLYSSQAFSQSKGLELKLEIFRDTVEFLQPFEYCMYFSNNSSKSVEIYALPWELGRAERPWIEIKASGEFKWKKLYRSDMVLGLLRSIEGGPMDCWSTKPRIKPRIPPKAHYCRQDTYYPLWTNESQIIWKPNKKYKVRIAFGASKDIGIIYSNPVIIYVKSSVADNGFANSLLKEGLNTEQIFQSWTYCKAPDSIKAKLSALAIKYPNTHFAFWVTSQTLECKLTMLDRNQELEPFQKKEAASSLLHEQKALTEKLLAKGFNILSLYTNNIENWWWLFDIDFYGNETDWIQKMRVSVESSCNCQ